MVVDDENPVRGLAGGILEPYGYSVLRPRMGTPRWNWRAAVRPAGAGAARSLDARNERAQTIEQLRFVRPDLPILVSSGYDEGDVLPKFNNRRLFGFLHKPYTPAQLSEKGEGRIAEAAASASTAGTVEAGGSHPISSVPAGGFRVQ